MESRKKDIFDKVMMFTGLRNFETLYRKYKEILLYLLFGGLTFIVGVGSYAFFNISIGLNELVANILSWIVTVLFAYFTNRTWVFESRAKNTADFMKETFSFFGGRILTLVVEEIILAVFITLLGWNSIAVKIIAQVVVIVLNYIISKLLVFKKK
ncbi:MAG: GtrA domain-containing protein [Lachnoclostridium sp.]|jgi:putative flippase GtrA